MSGRLPAAEWTKRPDLAALVAVLGPGNARYVGGAVRDTLLGLEVKDIDLATPLEPRAVMRLLKTANIRTVPTGIEHGTITALLDTPIEITTLRRDVSTDGRRATVAFSDDWQEDAARRDFTINALYGDPVTLEVSDWFGGLDDLSARRVRFIGDPRERIREDHLRILRYFRFQARFGSLPANEDAELACADLADLLTVLSRERVGMETMNLLALPDPAPTVARMAELGVLAVILPEAQVTGLAALVAGEHRQDVAPEAIRRLAALLPADTDVATQVAARFRLSGAQKKRLITAAGREKSPLLGEVTGHRPDGGGLPSDAPPPSSLRAATSPTGGKSQAVRALAYRIGKAEALDRLLLSGADIVPLEGWNLPILPLKGGQIVARGVSAGPKVAQLLKRVEDRWVDEGFPHAERVAALLDEELIR